MVLSSFPNNPNYHVNQGISLLKFTPFPELLLGCNILLMYNQCYTRQHSTCRRREKVTKWGTLYKCIRPKANIATDKGSGTLAAIFKSLL